MRRASFCLFLLLSVSSAAFASDDLPLVNWPVPGNSATTTHGFRPKAAADLSGPLVFVPVTPCRVVDTRNATGAFGGPIFNGGETRSYTLPSSSCTGLLTGMSAASLNITVTSTPAGGFLTAWPYGATQPGVANLTWFGAGQTLTSASIVPTASGGTISVFVGMAGGTQTHVIIDINGYFVGDGNTLNAGEHLSLAGSWNGGLIRGMNTSTSATEFTSGVRGVVSGAVDEIAGVTGLSEGRGANFGVRGTNGTASTNSAGVLGVSFARPLMNNLQFFASAVRGENGNGGIGILGLTRDDGQINGGAVEGVLLDSSGNNIADGLLGVRGSSTVLYGVFAHGNMAATGTKPFIEPHPTDASKVIRYVALEGPEAGTYFRGRGKFHNGQAVIDVPDSFRMVTDTDGLTVQITPIGPELTTANVVSADLDKITFRGNHDVEFFYLVQGVRKAYKDWQPIAEGSEFVPNSPIDTIPAYLSDEAKRRLIQNRTYNADGTVNMATAAREGWTKAWAARQDRQLQKNLTIEAQQ